MGLNVRKMPVKALQNAF